MKKGRQDRIAKTLTQILVTGSRITGQADPFQDKVLSLIHIYRPCPVSNVSHGDEPCCDHLG